MKTKQIFTEALANLDTNILTWVEDRRHGPKEFFGLSPNAELDPEFFIEPNGSPRIPLDIGDAFNYQLVTPIMTANFGRQYVNTSPLSAHPYLQFNWGKGKNKENTLAETGGFEFLNEAKLVFYLEKYNLFMQSQGLEMQECDGFGENQFTNRGREIMTDFISQKRKLSEFHGLKEPDKNSLVSLLEKIEKSYSAKTLEPHEWFYT